MDDQFTDDLDARPEAAVTGGGGSVGSDLRMFAVGALVGAVFAAAAWWVGSLDAFSATDPFAGPRRGPATPGLVAAVSALIVGAAVACWAFMGRTRRPVRSGSLAVAYLLVLAATAIGTAVRAGTDRSGDATASDQLSLFFTASLGIVVLITAVRWSVLLHSRGPQPYDPALSPKETNTLATSALVISIAGHLLGTSLSSIVAATTAVVFAWAALRRISRDAKIRGRASAIVALTIALANVALFALFLATSALTSVLA